MLQSAGQGYRKPLFSKDEIILAVAARVQQTSRKKPHEILQPIVMSGKILFIGRHWHAGFINQINGLKIYRGFVITGMVILTGKYWPARPRGDA